MKKIIQKYKDLRLKNLERYGQWYADYIIRRLKKSTADWEFDHWLLKGFKHDYDMIYKYDIYLD